MENAREFYIKTFLFWGCLTGRRLKKELGEEYCDKIVWEEVSPEIGGYSAAKFPPDYLHISKVIEKHKPTHIIVFGKIAESVLMELYHADKLPDIVLLVAPHPAARQGNIVIQQLRMLRKLLDEEKEYENANLH